MAEHLAFPYVADARFLDGFAQVAARELRMAPRSRIRAHVDQRADAGFL
jgi:hypothetical protein